MIFPDNPEAMTHFVRRDRIAGLWPGGRASPIAGGADWPSAARSRGHVSSFNAKTRNASETFAGISGFAEPPVGIEPTTYSLRVNRSAD